MLAAALRLGRAKAPLARPARLPLLRCGLAGDAAPSPDPAAPPSPPAQPARNTSSKAGAASESALQKIEDVPAAQASSSVAEPKMINFYNHAHPVKHFFDHPDRKIAGRAWTAKELRLKSFEDLQKLYMVLLMERNKLLSEKYRAKVTGQEFTGFNRPKRVRASIARLLTVVNERSKERALLRKAAWEENLAEKIKEKRNGSGKKAAEALSASEGGSTEKASSAAAPEQVATLGSDKESSSSPAR